jgi:hypothetical protein
MQKQYKTSICFPIPPYIPERDNNIDFNSTKIFTGLKGKAHVTDLVNERVPLTSQMNLARNVENHHEYHNL